MIRLYLPSWGFDWQGHRPMRPDLLGGPGPGEVDSGLLHGESRRMMGNEEMRMGGDFETDLDRGGEEAEREKKQSKLNLVLCVLLM